MVSGEKPQGPLAGIRVFDMTMAAVGPWASMMLGSLGADVIKVERPEGDVLLNTPPMQRGLSCAYTHCNLNKRSITLDLKAPSDFALALRLIETSDVFVVNLRAGTAEKLGLGYDDLRATNPRLVYAASSAWGYEGPMRKMGGAALSVEAFSGCASVTGSAGEPAEMSRLAAMMDVTTSSYIVAGVLQGLLKRQKTGEGSRIYVPMLGSAIAAQTTRIAEYFATGVTPPRLGSATTTTVPHQAFLCQDQKWLAVGVLTDTQWQGLVEALAAPELMDDPAFATNEGRVNNREVLIPKLEEIFLGKPAIWWTIRLRRFGVPNSYFLDFETLRWHQQVQENQYMVPMDIPHQGQMWFGGIPWKFGLTTARVGFPPVPGQHTDEVIAGLDELSSEVESITKSGGE